ncbi:MAG: hypothetical protein ABI400_08330 [Lacisediminihabitans sp.]
MSNTSTRVAYRLIRPPGWVHIVLDESADATGRVLAERIAFAAPQANRVQARHFFDSMVGEAIVEARANGGQDLYLPTEPVDGIPLSMSIIVAVSPPQAGTGSPSEALLAFSANDPTAKASTIDNQLAVRRYVDVAAKLDGDGKIEQPASRQITYLTTPPDDERVMLITSSILRLDVPDGDTLLEAMEFLFDAMVGTVRFGSGRESS